MSSKRCLSEDIPPYPNKKNRHRTLAMPVFWCRWRDLPGCGQSGGGEIAFATRKNSPPDCFLTRTLQVPASIQKTKGIIRMDDAFCLVPVAGLEPARYCYQWILSPPRLPIPTHRRLRSAAEAALRTSYIIAHSNENSNTHFEFFSKTEGRTFVRPSLPIHISWQKCRSDTAYEPDRRGLRCR